MQSSIKNQTGEHTVLGNAEALKSGALKATDLPEIRIWQSLLFKIAVELCMVLHVTAAANQIDEDTLSRLRGLCVEEVKRLRGAVRLEDAVRFQNGDD